MSFYEASIALPAERDIVWDTSQFVGDLTGNQTVLIVDDEDLLLTMGETILSGYGYTVYTANSGHKALDLISKSDKPIDLVITDLVMPGMSGSEFAAAVRKKLPNVPVILLTGHGSVESYIRTRSDGVFEYINKPVEAKELRRIVAAAIRD